MNDNQKVKNNLFERAVCSDNLVNRAKTNNLYGSRDFNQWVKSVLSKINYSSVLDVCCGTGNQLVLYADQPGVNRICGVDISREALQIAIERLKPKTESKSITLVETTIEQMFSTTQLIDSKFNLISCFYGLYYSSNVKKTIEEIVNHLTKTGTFLIVGPYGDNNRSLFDLLENVFDLPEIIISSSTSFMEKEVLPMLLETCKVDTESFLNKICYPNPKSVIDYWKSSTFYFPEYESRVVNEIEKRFTKHSDFVVEKHVMAFIARKIA